MRRAGWAFIFAGAACGSPPQQRDETAVTFLAAFTAEPGVNTKVVFPAPADAAEVVIEQGITVDGGTFSAETDTEGLGYALQGLGSATASFSAARLTGLGQGTDLPAAILGRAVPDGGPEQYYFRVNKAGASTVDVQFEYTAQRNCGGGCGGKKSWTYSGSVGLALQEITLTYVEVKQP